TMRWRATASVPWESASLPLPGCSMPLRAGFSPPIFLFGFLIFKILHMSDDKKVIFSMSGLTKTYKSANVPVLKNIYLSFFYGAKIGILGLNGSGKSTLLKIIAGVDKNYQGDVVFSPGHTVGLLEQEPQLDGEKTVLEVVREGVAQTVAILDEYNKINDMFG